MWIESAWDVLSLATGTKSLVNNIKQGNVGAAIVDGIGVVVDAAAVVLPIVPGGAGVAIKGTRAVNKATDATKVVDKGTDAVKIGKYSDIPDPKTLKRVETFLVLKRKKYWKKTNYKMMGRLLVIRVVKY